MTGPTQPPKGSKIPGAVTGAGTKLTPSPAGATKVTGGAPRGSMSPKAMELGRSFLSALFMGLRTAQIHDPANKAFERAVAAVRASADALYAATGGFSINFVDESAFLNGIRLRFDGGSFDAMRTLRHILESKELGGLEMRAPPSYDAVRKLVLLFSTSASATEAVSKEDLLALQIGVLGVQRFADASRDGLRIDRRIFAVQSYAKLLLAFREQWRDEGRERRGSSAPRLRAVRVVQDLVELAGDRADFLLRLGSNHLGAPVDELHAVNVSVLSIALGRALGLARQDLVDIGVSALFHDLGRGEAVEPSPVPHANIPVLGADGDGPVTYDGELQLADDWGDDDRQEVDLAHAPLPSGNQTDLARASARGGAPLAYDGELELALEDDDAPVVLPLEYLGELTPLDPADLSPADDAPSTADVDPAGSDDALEALDEGDLGLGTAVDHVSPFLSDEHLSSVLPDDALDPAELPNTAYHAVRAPHPMTTSYDGEPGHAEELLTAQPHPHTAASFARILVAGGLTRNSMVRAVVAAEHHDLAGEQYAWGAERRPQHPFSRIVAVADAYDALTSGLGSDDGQPMHALDALARLQTDRSGRVDQRLVDLLVNVLRAFPVGTAVVLDTGERAVVASHAGGTRWDRPVVRTLSKVPRNVDLMMRAGERFLARILSTARAAGDEEDTGDLPRVD